MSNLRPVERALATLLPTHENEMPPELLSLAQNLFAQSRSYSSSLKPEEEIARPHACAEIACKRLARTLKLPPLMGHPPCPPRIYKKLYTFLEKSVGNSTSKNKPAPPTPNKPSSTPRKASGKDTGVSRTPSKQFNTPSKGTSLGKRALDNDANKTPSRMTPLKRARFAQEPLELLESIKDAPHFVMPSIRTVCKILSTPAPRMTLWSRPPISRTLPPHIFAGVSSILHFISQMTKKEIDALDEDASEFVNIIRNPEQDSDDYKEVILALIVAVYFLVLARRRRPLPPPTDTSANNKSLSATGSDNPPPVSPAAETRKMDKKTFTEMRQTALTSLGLPATEKRHGEDVDAWIEVIQKMDWAKGQEWFNNIPLAGERRDDADDDDDDEIDGDGQNGQTRKAKRRKTNIFLHAGKNEEGLLLPGLGTMMQDRVDYLSEDRKEDFLDWKADILERIGKMMKAGKMMVV